MEPDDWFTLLADALERGGSDEGAHPRTVSDGERDALLDLARVAAHTSERWTAPVSTFLAGLRYADLPAGDRAAALRALVDTLDDPDAP